jgi:hypothetical protein
MQFWEDWINIQPLCAAKVKTVNLMADEVKEAPKTEETKEEVKPKTEGKEAETKVEATEEVKMGELLKEEPEKESRTVPEAVLIEQKRENKELKKDLAELKELIKSGASNSEVSNDLKEIAEEHNVDIDFLNKLTKSIKGTLEAEFNEKIKPIAEKGKREEYDRVFNQHYDRVLENLPEYKGIADKDTVKMLSLSPDNANRTLKQILDTTYGRFLTGKKTLESVKGKTGETITDIDFGRARKDGEYFKEIMADPELKKKYNENLVSRINL